MIDDMDRALELDREKLIALGADPGPEFMTCDNCGGDGGFERLWSTRPPPWGDGADDGEWVECQECAGSGWIIGTPESLTLDDLSPPQTPDQEIRQ